MWVCSFMSSLSSAYVILFSLRFPVLHLLLRLQLETFYFSYYFWGITTQQGKKNPICLCHSRNKDVTHFHSFFWGFIWLSSPFMIPLRLSFSLCSYRYIFIIRINTRIVINTTTLSTSSLLTTTTYPRYVFFALFLLLCKRMDGTTLYTRHASAPWVLK